MVIPESDYYDTSDEEEIASAEGEEGHATRFDFGYWLFKRDERDVPMEVSQLHLIQWEKLVVDVGSSTFLRVGNTKGDAVRRIVSEVKLACIECSPDTCDSGSQDEPKVVRTLRGVLNISAHVRPQELLINFENFLVE